MALWTDGLGLAENQENLLRNIATTEFIYNRWLQSQANTDHLKTPPTLSSDSPIEDFKCVVHPPVHQTKREKE